MSKKLYVGNLSYDADDAALKDHFAQAGNVVSATIIRFRDSGRSKGFGFVTFATDEAAAAAEAAMNGKDVEGRAVVVNVARPREERPPRTGGYNRDNGNSY